MVENGPIHFQIEKIATAIDANIKCCHAALQELNRLSLMLFSEIRAERSDIESWFKAEGFGVDDAGFWLMLPLQEAFRSQRAPWDAISYSWPPGLRDDAQASFRMYCLRNIGPHLHGIRSSLPDSSCIYYQDVTNTSIQFPYIDQREAITPDFEWSSYHTFISVKPANNPGRKIQWTPPNIDYAGEGLIVSASIPVYLKDEFIGLWSIDLPVKSLHQDFIFDKYITGQVNFIVDSKGSIMVHPTIETEIDKAKGSIFQHHFHTLGPEFESLSLEELKKTDRGQHILHKKDGSDLIAFYETIPGIEWIFFATFPRSSMQNAANKRIREALDRVKSGDFSYRLRSSSEIEQVRLIAEGYNDMAATLENQEKIRKKAQQDLRKSEEMFRNLFEQSHDAIFIHKSGGTIHNANRSASKLLEYTCEELCSMNIMALFPKESAADAEKIFDRFQEEESILFEAPLISRSGAILTMEISASIISRKQGLFQVICRDLSERMHNLEEKRGLEKRLQHYQKMEAIGTLAGGIAHDFNNILFPIMGYAEMLFDDLPKESPEYIKVKNIYKAAGRARDLTMQILTFSRHGDQELQPVQYQMIIKEALKLLRASIPKDIEIVQKINQECGPVFADPTKLHQIVMNLCTNAFHAVQNSRGRFEVALDEVQIEEDLTLGIPGLQGGEYIHLSVSDNGHGIRPEIMPLIFDPYFTTKDEGKGTGLGLSVTYGIVKDLNGEIKVYSEPGKGTTFHVYLPRVEMIPMETTSQKEPIARGTEHLLLVDDEVSIVKMGRQMLERYGYKVTTHTDSIKALECFKCDSNAFDLVITDMTMPNMTGEALAAEIKKVKASTPIILCTGFSEKVSKKNYSNKVIDEFLMKPVSMHTLNHAIRKLLD